MIDVGTLNLLRNLRTLLRGEGPLRLTGPTRRIWLERVCLAIAQAEMMTVARPAGAAPSGGVPAESTGESCGN